MRKTAVLDLAERRSCPVSWQVFSPPCEGTNACAGPLSRQKPVVFHVKYVSEGTLYIDAGRNADLQEGMKLSVINPPPDGMVNDGIRFRGYPHVAELNVISLADTSAVCDVISTSGELQVGQLAFLTPDSVEDRHLAENAREAEDYPITVGFTSGDPLDQELRSTKAVNPNLTESPLGVMRARFGFSYGGIQEAGMSSTQLGMMIDADLDAHWRDLLEFQRILAGLFQYQHEFHPRGQRADADRPDEPHLPDRIHVSEPVLAEHRGDWAAVSALGAEPEHDRRRATMGGASETSRR